MSLYVIGLDYGTDSCRAVLLDTKTGAEVATSVHEYTRWKSLDFCEPINNQFRQHPLDHIEGLEATVSAVLAKSGVNPTDVKAITIDTTGSSPIPLAKDGQALAFKPGYENNPNAMMVLWKDHTAIREAEEINELAENWGGVNYIKYEGGIYSSEWFWAKILHIVREDDTIREGAFTWMEHCDYLTYVLVDQQDLSSFKRSRCAAGHKAMWHTQWGGLPAVEFLEKLDPYLAALRSRLYEDTYTSDVVAGNLNSEWAKKLGLTTDTVVTVGTFDAHAGAVGAKIEDNTLVRVMGTSTCDIMVSNNETLATNSVKGICGQVDGSVIPGRFGLEAGQSAFGDVLAWFKSVLSWPIDHIVMESSVITAEQKAQLQAEFDADLIKKLTEAAQEIDIETSIPVALDWINGRRTPDANQSLKGAFSNLNLGTRAPHMFLALINSICFGSKMIVDRFVSEGVVINTVIGIGGVAKKSAFIMQSLANTLNMPVKVAESEQAPALGAAIYASVGAGIYPNVFEASQVMGSPFIEEYHPQPEMVERYAALMEQYRELGISIEKLTMSKKHL